MNPTHRTRRLSITLAGLAAATLALPAGQGTATAATFMPPPTPATATAQPTPTGLTIADLHDLAKVKRDLFLRLAERSPRQQAAADPGKTPGIGVTSPSARHAPADNRFTDLLALDQVKHAVAWAEVQRAWGRQPQTGASRFTDQSELAQVKRQAAWKATNQAAGR